VAEQLVGRCHELTTIEEFLDAAGAGPGGGPSRPPSTTPFHTTDFTEANPLNRRRESDLATLGTAAGESANRSRPARPVVWEGPG
jgi:hypothetical protein